MNVRHLNHISQDWKWAGDISVFQMEEVLGKGYHFFTFSFSFNFHFFPFLLFCHVPFNLTFPFSHFFRVSGTVYKAKVRDAGFDVAIKVVSQTNAKIKAELEKEIGIVYLYLSSTTRESNNSHVNISKYDL
jgi:hypothetical protein